MSNLVKRMKKTVTKSILKFPPDMYVNPVGSLVVSAYILSGGKYDKDNIKKTWKKIVRKPELVDFWMDDPDFIDKILNVFGMERPKEFPIAMVQSKYNVLFLPYVEGKLYPIREDGYMPQTGLKGKVYPINFNKDTNIIEENVTK